MSDESEYANNPKYRRSTHLLIFGLFAFIAVINFKPSEPYLTDYLSCSHLTRNDLCHENSNQNECNQNSNSCKWNGFTCIGKQCDATSNDKCSSEQNRFCHTDGYSCVENHCYKSFSEDTVNNLIYPWSTYAYLPLLLVLSPLAELVSYRGAIILGSSGRLATRFLLLYGTSLWDMQCMQVTYALGTAAEDVFLSYIYRCVPLSLYQNTTSFVKIGSLLSHMIA
eukprot:gene16054-33734_t